MEKRLFDTKRHTNVKHKAEYRRIDKYYKSLERFKAQKARRRRILELQDQGVTIRQIAGQLQVSERTIKRDISYMKSYIEKRRTLVIRRADEESLDYFHSLSLKQQIDYVGSLHRNKERAFKRRSCKSLTITIDVDKAFSGRYTAVKFKPDLPLEICDGGRITLQLEACGRAQPIARIYVDKIMPGSLSLHTNQSTNMFVKPTLRGLKVVQSSEHEEAMV